MKYIDDLIIFSHKLSFIRSTDPSTVEAVSMVTVTSVNDLISTELIQNNSSIHHKILKSIQIIISKRKVEMSHNLSNIKSFQPLSESNWVKKAHLLPSLNDSLKQP